MDERELSSMVEDLIKRVGRIGADPRGGWSRLAFTEEEDAVHRFAREEYEKAGLQVETDTFGNLFAIDVVSTEKPRVMLGTHLDTVLRGGNFDGVVGFVSTLCGWEFARSRGKTMPVEFAVFRAEESTRYNKACLGSRAAFGQLSSDELRTIVDENTKESLLTALARSGWGAGNSSSFRIKNTEQYRCYLEVHIEQARVLEVAGTHGVVTSIRAPERRKFICRGTRVAKAVSAMILATEWHCRLGAASGLDVVGTIGRVKNFFLGADKINAVPGSVSFSLMALPEMVRRRFSAIEKGLDVSQHDHGGEAPVGALLTVTGRTDHSGGTPMGRTFRRDALVAAAEMVLSVEDELISPFTTEIEFYSDIRSNDSSVRTIISSLVIGDYYRIAQAFGVELVAYPHSEQTDPVKCLDDNLRSILKQCARTTGTPTIDVPSGAGHDAMIAHQAKIPTAMLFVPCKEGISHSPDEFAETKDIVSAAKIVAEFIRDGAW